MTINEAISVRTKKILKEKNISQYRLEKETGLYHSTVVTLLRHKTKSCNIKTLALIVHALGITLQEFFDDPVFDFDNLEID